MSTPELFGRCHLPGCVNPVVGQAVCDGCRDGMGTYLLPTLVTSVAAPNPDAWIAPYMERRRPNRPRVRAKVNVGTCVKCGRLNEIIVGIVDRHDSDNGRTCPGSGLPPRGQL